MMLSFKMQFMDKITKTCVACTEQLFSGFTVRVRDRGNVWRMESISRVC